MVESDDEDLTEEEEIEEKIVLVELDNKHVYNKQTELKFVGLNEEEPLLNVDGISYLGQWEDAFGTLLLLDERPLVDKDPVLGPTKDTQLEVIYKSDKILKMKRSVIVPKNEKTEMEDLRKDIKSEEEVINEFSSDEEQIDDFYTNQALLKLKSDNTEIPTTSECKDEKPNSVENISKEETIDPVKEQHLNDTLDSVIHGHSDEDVDMNSPQASTSSACV